LLFSGVAYAAGDRLLPFLHCSGRKQTQLAFKDEVNVFRRTLLYAGPPNSSRWYEVAEPGETVGARVLIYLRRRDGVRAGDFRKLITRDLVPALADTGALKELRVQTFLPWPRSSGTPRTSRTTTRPTSGSTPR
jgi:hypothetical protein